MKRCWFRLITIIFVALFAFENSSVSVLAHVQDVKGSYLSAKMRTITPSQPIVEKDLFDNKQQRFFTVFIGTILFTLALYTIEEFLISQYGMSMLESYIRLFRANKFLVSGLTAALIGAVSEIISLYLSDNPARRYQKGKRFVLFFFIRILQGGLLFLSYKGIDFFFPPIDLTITSEAARIVLSIFVGVGMVSIINIFFPRYFALKLAKEYSLQGKFEEAFGIKEEYNILNQRKKVMIGIEGRLPVNFLQHGLVQVTLANQIELQVLVSFATGFLMVLYANYISNERSPRSQKGLYLFLGLTSSLFSLLLGLYPAAVLAFIASLVIYGRRYKIDKSERYKPKSAKNMTAFQTIHFLRAS